jgi:predicted GNAT family acetyltransferase
MTDISLESPKAQFAMTVEGERCELDFSVSGAVMDIRSVRVPKAVGGRGIAGQLTRHALDWGRSQSLAIKPTCPYVAKWLDRHPDHGYALA